MTGCNPISEKAKITVWAEGKKPQINGPWVLASSVSDLVGLQEGLGLASLSLLLLCPQRQLGVDHEALPPSLDLGPAGLGAEGLTGRPRDH